MWRQYYLATRSVPQHGVRRGDYLRMDLDIDSAKPTPALLIRAGAEIREFTWEEWCNIMIPAGSTPVPAGEEPAIQIELGLAD